jgi:hypothetical protein
VDTANPYASPLVQSRLPASEPDISSAWRDGDAVLIRRRGGSLPKACIKTNQERRVLSYSITTLTNRSALAVLALFLIPFVGLLLGCLVVLLLLRSGNAGNTIVWLKPRSALRLWAHDFTVVLLVLTGNLLSGYGMLGFLPMQFLLGMLCTMVGIAVSMLPFQMLGFLKLELRPPDLVCIYGAHRDYLDRLSPWEPSAVAMSNSGSGVAIAG